MVIDKTRSLLVLTLCAATLSGCGQKGDLYLPDESIDRDQAAEEQPDEGPPEERR